MTTPKRAFEIVVTVQGDTWDDAVDKLCELANHVEEHGRECALVSGGVHSGGWVEVNHNPDMTHEKYMAAVESMRARKTPNAESPPTPGASTKESGT